MIAALYKEMDRLLCVHRAGRPLAFLFDYDGTLVPIVEHPALARLSVETRGLLERLAGQPQVTLGILSGRRIEDLKDMVGLSVILPSPSAGGEGRMTGKLCYCGISGLELELEGVQITHPEAAKGRELVERLAAPLCEVAAPYPGAWVENKQLGLTLHYRAVAPHQTEELRQRAQQVLQPFGERVRILDAAMAIEIAPALGWTKGYAVRVMVAHAGANAVPLYAGNEANDRDALEAATALGGVSIGIGPGAPSSACHRLRDPVALVNLLSIFVEALGLPASRQVNSEASRRVNPVTCKTAGRKPAARR